MPCATLKFCSYSVCKPKTSKMYLTVPFLIAAFFGTALSQETCGCAPQPIKIELSCAGNGGDSPHIPYSPPAHPDPVALTTEEPYYSEPESTSEVGPIHTTGLSLYEHSGYWGQVLEMGNVTQCTNLRILEYQVSAVIFGGSCIHLYSGEGCTGESRTLTGPGSVENLTTMDFNDKTMSVGPCY